MAGTAGTAERTGNLQVGIVVRDLDAVTPFYQAVLGVDDYRESRPAHGLIRLFACGEGLVKIMQLDEPPHTSNPSGGNEVGCTGLRWFTFFPGDDIEAVFERAVAAGGKVVHPLQEYRPGKRYMILEDPEGSCWVEVLERPS
jgi:predicted enzyme related to lactoylglutathione lyase